MPNFVAKSTGPTLMLKLLFRMWFVQKRRDFHWQSIFITLYLLALVVMMAIAVWVEAHEQLARLGNAHFFDYLAPIIAVSFIVPDLMLKIFWHRDPVEMDDSLRTRPMPRHTWSRFVVLSQLLSGLTWMMPACYIVLICLFGMGWLAALLSFLVVLMLSLVNSLVVCCWRRAPGNRYTLPIIFGYLVYLFITYASTVATAALALLPHLRASRHADTAPLELHAESLLIALGVSIAVMALALWALYAYFNRMRNYNEESSSSRHVHNWGKVSLMSMEWVSVLRSKRMRTSVIVIAVIFLLNGYLQQNPEIISDLGFNSMLLLSIAFPSIILGQWCLGIEANYCHGIWSRPWPIETILRNKYYFFVILNTIMTILLMPAVFLLGMNIFTLLASFVFASGFYVLLMLPTCLYSSRMDLFSSAFFNYQGGNKRLNIYSFVILIPLAIYYASYILLATWQADIIMAAIGIVGFALHRWFIHWLTGIWLTRRYTIMERWLTE